jgi:hypothetical protein
LLILSVSADNEANDRLVLIIARSIDRRDCRILVYCDGARLLHWLAMRKSVNADNCEAVQRSVAASVARFVHEHAEKHKDFQGNMVKLSVALSEMQEGAVAAVLLMEELEKPLSHRDAKEAKLAACDRHFDNLSSALLKATKKSTKNKDLVMRATSAVISVLYNQPSRGNEDKYSKWSDTVRISLDHSLSSGASAHSAAFLRNVVSAHDSLCLPTGSLVRIWNYLVDCGTGNDERIFGEVIGAMDADDVESVLQDFTKSTVSSFIVILQ